MTNITISTSIDKVLILLLIPMRSPIYQSHIDMYHPNIRCHVPYSRPFWINILICTNKWHLPHWMPRWQYGMKWDERWSLVVIGNEVLFSSSQVVPTIMSRKIFGDVTTYGRGCTTRIKLINEEVDCVPYGSSLLPKIWNRLNSAFRLGSIHQINDDPIVPSILTCNSGALSISCSILASNVVVVEVVFFEQQYFSHVSSLRIGPSRRAKDS